jgi:hypothetical protein
MSVKGWVLNLHVGDKQGNSDIETIIYRMYHHMHDGKLPVVPSWKLSIKVLVWVKKGMS